MVGLSETIKSQLQTFISQTSGSEIAIELWDGTVLSGDLPEKLRIRIKSPDALKRLLYAQTPISLGESYITGDLDLVGDYDKAFELAEKLFEKKRSPGMIFKAMLLRLAIHRFSRSFERRFEFNANPDGREGAKQAISYHYDLPVEFWQKWLDKSMAYSCAYFNEHTNDITKAQLNKYEFVCRKLGLKEGERLLDLGCGWGGLAIYAAMKYGAKVLAVTLSKEQAKYATEQTKRLGLDRSCTIVNMDLRDVRDGPFDKVSSIGAVEHFGKQSLPEFFAAAWNNLKDGGLFLVHGITSPNIETGRNQDSFTERYLFPGFQLSSVSHLVEHAERAGFEIRDVEGLREHYVRTFDLWRERLEKNSEEVIRSSSEVVYRIFLLSLWFMRYSHATGKNGLHQFVLAKPVKVKAAIPVTRDSWYRPWPNQDAMAGSYQP